MEGNKNEVRHTFVGGAEKIHNLLGGEAVNLKVHHTENVGKCPAGRRGEKQKER